MATLASNRRARFDYELKKEFRAGIALTGSEVKSAKAGNMSLAGSMVRVGQNAAWLVNAFIAPYQQAREDTSRRSRKLLLTSRELGDLVRAKQSGLHIVPIAFRTSRGLVKVDLAVGKIRRKHDKRQAITARENKRQISQRTNKR